jgi:Domain of unknown function (DUF4296)
MNRFSINKKYNLLLILGLLIQCRQSVKFPVNEIKMAEILTDIHIAEAAVDNESGDMKDSITRLYYPQIFEHHGIKQWEFDSTMSMLSTKPIIMNRIFKTVIDNIQKKSTSDSLSKVK